jgi:hypothetical protein
VNFTSVSVSVLGPKTSSLSTLGIRLQTPTLIGCMLLKSFAFRRC